jgi:hypothetical protein
LESVWSETETAECVLEMIQLLFDWASIWFFLGSWSMSN